VHRCARVHSSLCIVHNEVCKDLQIVDVDSVVAQYCSHRVAVSSWDHVVTEVYLGEREPGILHPLRRELQDSQSLRICPRHIT
jgi:hypothetical protein